MQSPLRVDDQEWRTPWKLGIHALSGTFVFIVIAAVAVGLNLCVQWLEGLHISKVILWGLEIAEYVLFAADLFLFIVFLVQTSKAVVKSLCRPKRQFGAKR